MEHYDVQLKPKTFKEKWQNYWYHNKAVTFIALAIALSIIVGLYSCASKEKVDFRILASAHDYLYDTANEKICEILGKYVTDYDGDGKIITRMNFTLINDKNTETLPSDFMTGQYQKFAIQIANGDGMLIIGDREVMDNLAAADVLEDIDNGENGAVKYISLKDNKLFKGVKLENADFTLDAVTDNLYMGLRAFEGTRAENSKYSEFSYKTAKKIIETIKENM